MTLGLVQGEELHSDRFRSSARLARLLAGTAVEPVPIRLGESAEPRDWIGRVSRDAHGWRVAAAPLAVDALTGKTRLRLHSLAGQLGGLVRREGLEALHVYGVAGACAVAAQAAVEEDVPLLVSFLEGEAEGLAGAGAAELRACLRAARACTVPCPEDGERVRRLLDPELQLRVIPPFVEPPPGAVGAPAWFPEGPVVGCLARHGRESGLDLLLEAFREVGGSRPASLLLLGEFHPAEASVFGPWIDRHPLAGSIVRPGAVDRESGLGYLRSCAVAAWPLPTASQVGPVLEAMAAGVPVLASPVGPLAGVRSPGVRLVAERSPAAWAAALSAALDGGAPARPQRSTGADEASPDFSAAGARERWLDFYREAGLCS